ncbi:DUF2017 domain-containing protein [Corynebacterium comes]|uniref:Uncharacterized protein n=1 Tax=Corynebacterium comes TaxID=2675218 RepID=A0A6B8W653_9CORY|nr:DUF2017 domain-containing protein [Corynebacterium comes]QGU05420.1 hypothetical protein CETAM_10885 [Corynebacterium comes]
MQEWRRKKGLMRAPRYHTVLEPLEREILGNITAAVSEAIIARAQSAPRDELSELTGIPASHKKAPEDPALARLLPDFERAGDEEYAGDNSLLRSLHENDICRAKLSNLQIVAEKVGPDGGVEITLSEEEAHAFLAGLNDLRLYVSADGTGGEEARVERESLVDWLGYNQDSLLTALTRG